MKLVNRVSTFFLAALAVVLAGYSLLLYVTVRNYLNSEFDNRLQGALQVLAASIEVEPEDVTWYPEEYTLDFEGSLLQDARWLVADEEGNIVDQSSKLSADSPRDAIVIAYGRTPHPRHAGAMNLKGWRITQRYLTAPSPQPKESREFNEYASLVVTVAMSHVELDQLLARLAVLLAVLPTVLWIVAVIMGRRYIGRALYPVRVMANQAASAAGADFDLRLPTSKNNDELADLSRAFNRLLDRLQQAFQQERRFSSDAAHQLRTPLTILQGELDVALRMRRSPEEYEACLQRLARVNTEMQQIVESLLLLARGEQEPTLHDLQPLDLAQWLPRYLDRWRQHVRSRDLSLHIDGPIWVRTSPSLLAQLLNCLVENALQYSKPGAPVRLDVRAQHRQVQIEVGDRGMGVPPKEAARIFDPFFRGAESQSRASGGAGLGLAVAQQMAALLNGSIRYQQQETGTGSRFVLTLPWLIGER